MEPQTKEQAERALQAAREVLIDLQALVKSRGWDRLLSIARDQEAVRISAVALQPLASGDKIYEQEFMKGEIAGIRLFMNLPGTQIEVLLSQLDNMENENDNPDSTGRAP